MVAVVLIVLGKERKKVVFFFWIGIVDKLLYNNEVTM